MQGAEAGLNRGSQNYNFERGNQMNAIGLGNSQQALALQRAQAQMSIGDMFRGYNQDLLNQHYNDYQDENNQQYRMLDILYQPDEPCERRHVSEFTTTQSGYSASPYSQLLALGLLGHSEGLLLMSAGHSLHKKDYLMMLGGLGLAATGLGAAGMGPLAGMLGGEAAAGAAGAAGAADAAGTAAAMTPEAEPRSWWNRRDASRRAGRDGCCAERHRFGNDGQPVRRPAE
jgi:hypothetical protein